MKLATRVNDYHSNLVQENVGFKVANSVHMMKILSDSLYSDKITAVIRELSTNAYDAHVAAGNADVPFYVHFPKDYDDLTFRIRDYGTGLSKERIFELYTVYGLSDKSNSNDYVGCLGLGSKSPFCYTNIFTTTSYYNGMKYVFINAINHRGQPQCNLMHSEETDEPNGLEISFDINKADANAFVSKARSVYRFFDVPPKTNLSSGFEGDMPVIPNDAYYHIFDNRYHTDNSYAIMGQVGYPLAAKHFNDKHTKFLIDSRIFVRFNVGEIDMDASREALQYNERTINVIKSKFDSIYKDLKNKIQSRLNEQDCLWNASANFETILKEFNVKNIDLFSHQDFTYNNEKLFPPRIELENKDGKFRIFRHGYGAGIKQNTQKTAQIYVSKEVIFIINDSKNTGVTAVRNLAKGKHKTYNRQHVYILIQPEHVKVAIDTFSIKKEMFITVSSIVKEIPKQSRVKAEKKEKDNSLDCMILDVRNKYGHNLRNRWNTTSIEDINNGIFYYVVLNKSFNYYKMREDNSLSDNIRNSYGNFYAYATLKNIDIYGLTPNRYKKIVNKKNWIPLRESVKEHLDNYYKDKKNIVRLQNLSVKHKYDRYKSLYEYLNKNTEMFKFLDNFSKVNIRAEDKQIAEITNFYNNLNSPGAYVVPVIKDIDFDEESIYPLLQYMSNSVFYDGKKASEAVANYINLINK